MSAPVPAWVSHRREAGWRSAPATDAVRAFHRSLPGYAPTPLIGLPSLAAELGVGRVLAKDESHRLGLPAFKALGASWAVDQVLRRQPPGHPVTLVAATDGNHGRAVARFARLAGHRAQVFLPAAVNPVAVRAVAEEGADVTVLDGSHDDAVAAAARAAEVAGAVLVQDTAWPGYEQIPAWIVEGYATLFVELDEQVPGSPDLVVVPTGVGSLLEAALRHYRSGDRSAAVVSAEPDVAACVAASLVAGRPSSVPTSPTAMAGLNCGTPSASAWPFILAGLDGAAVVTEEADLDAAYDLAALGLSAGPCGAASLAAARSALTGPGADERRAHLRLDATSTVVLLVTEGDDSNPIPPREVERS